MKIVQLIPSLDDGGAETLVKDYAIILRELGEEVYIVTVYNFQKSSNFRLLEKANIKIIPLFKSYNLLSRLLIKFLGSFIIPLRLLTVLNNISPDVVHIHLALLSKVATIVRIMPKCKLFYTCHTLPKLVLGQNHKNELNSARLLCEKYGLRIIALHDEMKKELRDLIGVNNILVLHNGINIKSFTNNPLSHENAKKLLGFPVNSIVIGHVGRFSKVKNHEFLIKVAYNAMKKRKDIWLLLVGAGPLKESIQKKVYNLGINNRVVFLSHRSDVPNLMKAMDVFLFPSKYEGFPITLIETQSVGLPCVVSDTITSEAFISNNIYPLSLKEDPEIWANTVISVADKFFYDPKIKDFDIHSVTRKLLEYYSR